MTHSHHISRALLANFSLPPSDRRSDFACQAKAVVRQRRLVGQRPDIVSQYSKHYPTSKIAGTRFEVVSVQRYDLPNGCKRDVYTLREL